jgi:hypothetical protein
MRDETLKEDIMRSQVLERPMAARVHRAVRRRTLLGLLRIGGLLERSCELVSAMTR